MYIFKTSKQTKREAQALVPHRLLDIWQVPGIVDLQVWRTANAPVCIMSNIKTCSVICHHISCCPHYRDAVYLGVLCAAWSWSDRRQSGPGVESLQVRGPGEQHWDELTRSSELKTKQIPQISPSLRILNNQINSPSGDNTFVTLQKQAWQNILATLDSKRLRFSMSFLINCSLTWKLESICCDLLSYSASTMISDSLWTMTSKGPWGSSGLARSIWEEDIILNK